MFHIIYITVDENRCNGCGNCQEVCPKGRKIWKIDKIAHASNLQYCHVCMLCEMKCRRDAIRVHRSWLNE
ncbi:MAG: ferredoxin family protein [Methanobrevibacter sp.]